MKNYFYLLVLLPIIGFGQSPTSTENYIKTTSYKKVNLTSVANPTADVATVLTTYFDGLGRPKQKVASKQSGSGTNLIVPIIYDNYGRSTKNYLPYPTTTTGCDYVMSAESDDVSYYSTLYPNNNNPFSDLSLEFSPLDKVLKRGFPGTDWMLNPTNGSNEHSIKNEYNVNQANEVKNYQVITTWNNGFYNISIQDNGYYSSNLLYKTITKDENWVSGKNNTNEEFINKEGRLILKRTYSDYRNSNGIITSTQVPHDTYYVYDVYGNLTYIIPPLVDKTQTITASILDGLCYQYKYDYKKRLVEKKIPGKQWEFIVYDKLNRIVAEGPSLSPFTNAVVNSYGWTITKYDLYNRIVLNAWMPTSSKPLSSDRMILQSNYNSNSVILNETKSSNTTTINGVGYNYTNLAYPSSTNFHLLAVNYYDDYNTNITFNPVISFSTPLISQPIFNNTVGSLPFGKPTVKWRRVLENITTYNSENSYILYDNKGFVVRNFVNNSLGGYNQIDSQIEQMTGRVNYTITNQKRDINGSLLTIRDDYTYSDQDRLLTHSQIINGGVSQLIAQNVYNDLGQIIVKKVGKTTNAPLQKVDYKYNIRGWLTDINDVSNLSNGMDPIDLFAFKINYNTVVNAPTSNCVPLYNGNISETYWRTNNDNIKRKYSYEYDALNRINNSIYQKPDIVSTATNSYNESMQYDLNGNIISLQRNGNYDDNIYKLQIDNLNYTYDTTSSNNNRLLKVSDLNNDPNGFKDGANTNNDFSYDDNGNLTLDQNKNITNIKYNILNLPIEIIFSNNTSKKINYIYNSEGVKIRKIVTNGTIISTTDYLNGFQYYKPTSAAAAVLKYFPTDEGYVSVTTSGTTNNYNYVFTYKDHLGNVRVSYGFGSTSSNPNGATYILQESNYYPFGLQHSNYNTDKLTYDDNIANGIAGSIVIPPLNYPLNKYLFQGQEHQDELGLNWDSFKWRNYDSAIGRFMSIDPLAQKYHWQSMYSFGSNQVIHSRELEGLEADDDLNDNLDGGNSKLAPGFDAESRILDSDMTSGTTLGGDLRNCTIFIGENEYFQTDNYIYSGEPSSRNNDGFNDEDQSSDNEEDYGIFDGYFKAYQQYDKNVNNPYSPYNPDGLGMTYNINIHTGIFADINFTLGFASNSANTTKFIFGFNTNFGQMGFDLPRFSSSISVDFYDNFGNNTDIFKGIEGFSGGYFGSFGIGGSRTTSQNLTKDGLINADSGVNTTSVSLGIGVNGGQTTNYTHVCN